MYYVRRFAHFGVPFYQTQTSVSEILNVGSAVEIFQKLVREFYQLPSLIIDFIDIVYP